MACNADSDKKPSKVEAQRTRKVQRHDHVLVGPSKTWCPALQSLNSRPPTTTTHNAQRPGLEGSKIEKPPSMHTWKRQVCGIAALPYSLCAKFTIIGQYVARGLLVKCCSRQLATARPRLSGNDPSFLRGTYSPGVTLHWPPVSEHNASSTLGMSSYTVIVLFLNGNFGWPRTSIGRSLYSQCLRPSRVRLTNSQKALLTSLNGRRLETCRLPRQSSLSAYANVCSRSFCRNWANGCGVCR